MPPSTVADYSRHSRWSDPGPWRACLADLPADAPELPRIVCGLILHPGLAAERGIVPPPVAVHDAELRSIPEMLTALMARDPRPLAEPRAVEHRLIATCRSYALLACAILREHRVPARLRVGFATYFTPGFAEDHWVCEYHDGATWRLVDTELGVEERTRFAIGFAPENVPRDRFLVAADAWLQVRSGVRDPERMGVSAIGLSGAWFAAASLTRDLAAVAKEELLPWDYWGPARRFNAEGLSPEWLTRLDDLAQDLSGGADTRALLVTHSWAAVPPVILSYPRGEPVEISLVSHRPDSA